MPPKILAEHDIAIAANHGIPMDDTRYFDDKLGIVAVDTQRWLAAQDVERKTWFSFFPDFQDDRSEEHALRFNHYEAVPMQCGEVLEIGCGPFTQARSILNGRSILSLTLLDPLLADYLDHPYCSYRSGKFYEHPVNLLAIPAGKLPASLSFDLVICVNVIEHVFNAALVLDKLISAVRLGGYLILGELCHEDYHPSESFNLAHPDNAEKVIF